MVRVGDVFEIGLSSNRKAYGHYVFRDKIGPMIQVFDLISEKRIYIDQLRNANPLFPPIFTGLSAAIRMGFWKIIGRMATESFIYPNFVSTHYNEKTGKAGIWFLWNGENNIILGAKLPDEYKRLEYLMVWSPLDVIHRIETGEYPFPYRALILNNEFTPRKN